MSVQIPLTLPMHLMATRETFIGRYQDKRVCYAPNRFGVVYDITQKLQLLVRRDDHYPILGEKRVLIVDDLTSIEIVERQTH